MKRIHKDVKIDFCLSGYGLIEIDGIEYGTTIIEEQEDGSWTAEVWHGIGDDGVFTGMTIQMTNCGTCDVYA